MRQLYVIPIIHSNEDLGNLLEDATRVKSRLFSTRKIAAAETTVGNFWRELMHAVQAWDVDWKSTQLYQDALPYTAVENAALIKMIVDDLAAQGSLNHQILKWLVEQGAVLHGSESPELLCEEYSLVKETMELALSDDPPIAKIAQLTDQQAGVLLKRDEFIAERIDKTLADDSLGLIFLGMLHRLEARLPSDIAVAYPFGKPTPRRH